MPLDKHYQTENHQKLWISLPPLKTQEATHKKSLSSCKISRQKFVTVVDVERMEMKVQTSDPIKSGEAQSSTISSYTWL